MAVLQKILFCTFDLAGLHVCKFTDLAPWLRVCTTDQQVVSLNGKLTKVLLVLKPSTAQVL